MDFLMGIDLGSTSLKAIIYDLQGNLVAAASRPTLKHTPPEHPLWVHWLPEQIWGGTAEAIREALSHLPDPRQLRGVAVTGMGLDGLPVGADGKWLYPFISWHDQRTVPQQNWWLEKIGNEKTWMTGGWPLWSTSTALRILWMQEHEPEILKRTDKWLLIEDFLNFMLCGKSATDYSMASCTAMWDQVHLDWSDELLATAGIERRLLPPASPSGTLLGEVHPAAAEATGLAVGTPVVLGGHDYLCGGLPVGAFKPGVVLDVTGTWEIVMTALEHSRLTPEVYQAGMTMENHVARGMYAAWGSAVAAEMLEWFRREYGSDARQKAAAQGGVDWDYLMADAAGAQPGSGGAFFLPHMSGSSCPVNDSRSMGAFVGLTNFTTRGEMGRAIIEGLNYQFLDIVRSMENGMGTQAEKFVAVGGAVKNKFWMQNKADIVGRPIEIPEIPEATPLGAAILAGIGVGLYKNEQDAYARVHRPGTLVEPDLKLSQRYAEWFSTYRQLYPALSPLHQHIFDRFRQGQ